MIIQVNIHLQHLYNSTCTAYVTHVQTHIQHFTISQARKYMYLKERSLKQRSLKTQKFKNQPKGLFLYTISKCGWIMTSLYI